MSVSALARADRKAVRGMKILMFISRYGPTVATSGPALSVRETVEALAQEHDVAIVARAGSYNGCPEGFPTNRWEQMDDARIFYADRHWRRIDRIVKILREEQPDLVYINSFFDHRSSLLPLALMRAMPGMDPAIMIAPRGEMSGSALAISSGRKRIYRETARLLGLHKHASFHAAGPQDQIDIENAFPGAPIGSALDIGISPPSVPPPHHDGSNALRLVFLGRINPMKNVDLALDILARCKEPVTFDIIGPEDGADYMAICEAKRAALPANVDARFLGHVPHEKVLGELSSRDLLFMPSRGENFCHAIHEALCVGTPVLISERTNWTPFLGADLSWALKLSDGLDGFAAKIDELAREGLHTRRARRAAILANNPAVKARDAAKRDTRRLFREALERHRAA